MKTKKGLRLTDVFVSMTDPRQTKKIRCDLVETLVIAVSGALSGADTFVEIEAWANEKSDWFRQYIKLENGIPPHDTFAYSRLMRWGRNPILFRFALEAILCRLCLAVQ
ncbi:hypothetical protein AGMMS49545_21060 [Betaproteobacteria bacterium]|nr:hypothetical protein AGMMS49545_21060 [Betaproteobacteria bacterium]GHU48390.1 hypothetical protein AGMMS50289_24940 [Betaproteobacteria bacterium]